MIDVSKLLQKSSRTATLGLKMIAWSEFNDYITPAIAVLVLGFIVTASRELGGISVKLEMIKEVKTELRELKAELKEDFGGIKEDLNLFKFGSIFILALGIGGALAQFYKARGS